MSTVRRQTTFIDQGGRYVLPRPLSVAEGHMRHQWFTQWAAGKQVNIAAPVLWQREAKKFGIMVLREYENGTFSVEPLADSDTDKG